MSGYRGVKAWRDRIRRKDPSKLRAIRAEEMRKWKRKHPDEAKLKARADHLRRYHGITLEDFERMELGQEGLCAICLRRPDRLDVDHDHKTGQIRMLLCGSCNRALGLLGEDPLRIASLLEYVKTFQSYV